MLTAEHRVKKTKNGVPYYAWVLKKGRKRNEALDCRVNALAALEILNPKWATIERKKKIRISRQRRKDNAEMDAGTEAELEQTRREILARHKKKKAGGFVNGWKK